MFATTVAKLEAEKRADLRIKSQTFVRLRVMDEEDSESMIALTMDISPDGLSLLTYYPLPLGTRVTIDTGEDFSAIGEVADWEWDYNFDMARSGLLLIEKHGNWPAEEPTVS